MRTLIMFIILGVCFFALSACEHSEREVHSSWSGATGEDLGSAGIPTPAHEPRSSGGTYR